MIVSKDVQQVYRALVDLKPKSVIATASLFIILVLQVNSVDLYQMVTSLTAKYRIKFGERVTR